MKGDGNADGKKLCTKQGTTPYEKASSTDKRCTMIGITALDVSPVMYLLIIQGKEANVSIEINIDVTINPEGKPDDLDFFSNNSGERKNFPGGSVCTYSGKEVPTLIRWNESASVTSGILVDMLKTLNFLDPIRRDGKCKPFFINRWS